MRLHGLARWLVTFGHQVTVITGMPNYPTGVLLDGYQGKFWMREEMDGVDVLRTWVYASPQRALVHRFANDLSFLVSSIGRGVFSGRRFDVVLASSPPLFAGLSGWVLARTRRIPLVFDIRDLWPDTAVEAGVYAPDTAITGWLFRLARFLHQRAAHLTPVTTNQQSKLNQAGVALERITVVPNGVDLDIAAVSPPGGWREQLGLGDRFVVIYAGRIGVMQGVEAVVDAAVSLRDQPQIQFLIVGDGIRRADIVQAIEDRCVSNITLLSPQPREAILSLLEAADVAWVPLIDDNLDDAVPSKMLEAWGRRKPVILSASGQAAQLVEQVGGGVVIPAWQPERLVEAVLALASEPDSLRDYGQAGYHFVEKHLERETLARRMEEVLVRVVGLEAR